MLDAEVYIDIANALKNKKINVPLSELEIDELDEQKLKYDNHYFSELFRYALISNNQQVIELLMAKRQDLSNIKDSNSHSLLHKAVIEGRKKVVKSLLERGVKANINDNSARIPLHYAVKKNKQDIVQLLIQHGANPNAKDEYSKTPFNEAIIRNHIDIVKLLISKADLNAKDEHGETPLHYVVKKNKQDIVQLLIQHGADLNDKDKRGRTPLDAAITYDHLNIVRILINSGAKINNNTLLYAAKKGDKDMIESLILRDASINVLDDAWETPLHIAVRQNNTDITQLLLLNKANVNIQDSDNETPLHIAARQNNEDIINLLIFYRANVNVQNSIGETPLHIAIKQDNENITESLISNGANIDNKLDLLRKFTDKGCIKVVKLLIDNKGIDLNAKDENNKGNTLLHVAAEKNHEDIARLLIENGADIDAQNNNGYLPLDYAISCGSADIVQLLIDKGAKVNISDNDLFLYSIKYNFKNVVEYLIDEVEDVNTTYSDYGTLLHYAAKKGYEDIVKSLICRNANANIPDVTLKTPLHYATEKGNINIVKLLILGGAHVDAKDIDGRTPLFLAVYNNNEGIVILLIANGANVNIHDNFLNTLLHYAAYRNVRYHIVELLVMRGADVNVHNQRDLTPIDIATNENNTEVVDLLRNGMQKTVGDLISIIKKINNCNNSGEDIDKALAQVRQRFDYNHRFGLSFENCPKLSLCLNDNVDLIKNISGINNTSYIRGNVTGVGLGLFAYFLLSKSMCFSSNKIIPNSKDKLFDSIYANDIKETLRLLKLGVNPNMIGKYQTPIHVAVLRCSIPIVKMLVEYGADINALNYEKNTALDLAVHQQDQDMVIILLDYGALIDIGNVPTIYAAALHKEKEIIKLLYDRGASIDAQNNEGRTALFFAVSSDSVEIANLLLRLEAKVNIRDHDGNFPIHLSVSHAKNIDMVELLYDYGADLDAQDHKGKTVLSLATAYDAKDKKDEEDMQDIISFLLAKNASSNIRDHDGNFPIHLAIEQMRHPVIIEKLLIANKDNINYTNMAVLTPLNLAVKCGNLDAVFILAQYSSVTNIGYALATATKNQMAYPAIEGVLLRCMLDHNVKDGIKLISTGSVVLGEIESKESLQPVSVKPFKFPILKRKNSSDCSSNTKSITTHSSYYSVDTKHSSIVSFKSCSSTSTDLCNRFNYLLDSDQLGSDSVVPAIKRVRFK